MDFKEAYQLPIGKDVEKKGRFSYLSWAYAVRHLRENFPDATWKIGENAEGTPVFFVGETAMVKVTVVVNDKEYTQWHPVLNNQNKPVTNPAVFDINTAIQRCLAKAIGLATGIGLALYAGEDLPTEVTEPTAPATNDIKPDQLTDQQEKNVILFKEQIEACNDSAELKKWWADSNKKVREVCGDKAGMIVYNHYTDILSVLDKK